MHGATKKKERKEEVMSRGLGRFHKESTSHACLIKRTQTQEEIEEVVA